MMRVLLKEYETAVYALGGRALQYARGSVRALRLVRAWLSLDRLLQVSPLQTAVSIQSFENIRR